jgi:hypothetical protein
VRGKTKAEVKDRLDELHKEIKAGMRTPPTYTVAQCVKDWLDSIERDPHTMAALHSQAKKWIYPKIGSTKLKDFSATDADRFFIGRNVVELIDLPTGQPGHPSRPMTQDQAAKVLKTGLCSERCFRPDTPG